MDFQNQSATEALLDDVIANVEGVLTEFANSDHFHSTLETSFGSDFNSEETARLRSEFLNQDFLDNIDLELLPSATLNGALGAYARATDSIYLSQNLLPQQASTVLLEEVGHAIDAQLNLQDRAGDEGAIFASLVERDSLNEEALSGLREEDDSAILTINGETIRVEQAEFTVTTASDSGEGSLRQAIVQANETAGADVITFDSSLSGETINLTNGQLAITDALTINGLGSDELTIDAGGNSRVFNIDDGDSENEVDVSLSDLRITGGSTTELGGGISNSENLTLTNSTFSGNSANADSGAGAIDNDGTASITNSRISGNFGGGIYNNSIVSITNSTISGNSFGSGINNNGGLSNADGTVSITNSTISSNSAASGGGINNYGTASITNSTISYNSTIYRGGGINNYGTASITDSTISGNSAGLGEGSYDNSAGSGGGINNSSYSYDGNSIAISITNSTISGNSAANAGGGIYNAYGTASITNSTLSGNSANSGGGIYNQGVTYNSSPSIATNINNSIVSGNLAETNGNEVYLREGGEISNQNSLFGDSNQSNAEAFSGLTPNDSNFAAHITATSDGTNPTALENILDPNLQDNFGLTPTHALVEGSPALDAGDNALLSLETESLETDQRGFARIVNDAVDLGAVEFGDGDPPAPPTVNLSIDPTEGSEADQTTFTLTATASETVSGKQIFDLITSGVDADDFVGNLPSTIAIADGETTGTVELTVNDDDVVEGEETATFSLENPNSVVIGSDRLVLGEMVEVSAPIIDNDEETVTPAVNLSIDPTEGSEAEQTTFTLTATASQAVSGEQTVALTTSGVDGDDFTGDLPSEITIADGETTGTTELTVNDDDAVEGEETATFILSNPSDEITLGDSVEASATIIDNDEETATPAVDLSIDPTQGSEANETTFTLTATASQAVSGEQTVSLTTSGDVDGDDFTGDLPGSIAIADGETTGTVELTVNDDDAVEGEETATFALENPSDGVTLGDSVEASATIIDNDEETATPTFDDLVFGTSNNDTLNASDQNNLYTGNNQITFTGAGEDLVDGSIAGDGSNRNYGGSNADELFAGNNDRLFGEGGNDTLDASQGTGNNRLYGGDDNDDLIAGNNDLLTGGNGDDRLFVRQGGNNLLIGNSGADQFWIATDEIPNSPNIITDFTSGEDAIGFGGFPDLSFSDLSLSQEGSNTLIGLDANDPIAELQGVQANTLTENDFVFAAQSPQ
ncbi:UNVERIFIED_CONTAM: hypothetical protein BEN50_01225 [Euhalothece sp. KZN 001]